MGLLSLPQIGKPLQVLDLQDDCKGVERRSRLWLKLGGFRNDGFGPSFRNTVVGPVAFVNAPHCPAKMSSDHSIKIDLRLYCGKEIAMGPGKADLLDAFARQQTEPVPPVPHRLMKKSIPHSARRSSTFRRQWEPHRYHHHQPDDL
jgi:hypothetical protein